MDNPKQTHYPLLIDTQLVNSTRFLDSIKTYKHTIVEMIDYIDMYCVASINRANKQTHDPVTNQVDFFKQLNDGELNLLDNTKGVRDDLHLPDQETIYDQISEKFGLDDLPKTDTEFILYWIEKYRTSHDLVKQLLHQSDMLPKETASGTYNTKNIYFNDFSESMYSLKSTVLRSPPRESTPVWDVKCTFIKEMGGKHTVPNQYTGTSVFNIHKDVQLMSNIMSRYTTSLFRNNMKNIIDNVTVDERIEDPETKLLKLKTTKITDSKQPHGVNLVPDQYHMNRMWQNAEPLARIVTETLGNMSYVLSYMDKNLKNNLQAWGRFRTESVIEQTVSSVDLLHNTLTNSFEEISATSKTIHSELS